MKVNGYIWAGGITNLPSWFKHNEEMEVSFEQIEELLSLGINIQIRNMNGVRVLFVDHKGFTQR